MLEGYSYAGQMRAFTTGVNNQPQEVLSLSLPKSACEVRFRVLSTNSKVFFGYSFEPSYDVEKINPEQTFGLDFDLRTDYRPLVCPKVDFANQSGSTEEIIIRSPTSLPERINFFVTHSGDASNWWVSYQIIGGKQNGY